MADPPWMQARDVATFRHPGTAPPPSLPSPPPAGPPALRQSSAHLLRVQPIIWYEDELKLELLFFCIDSMEIDGTFVLRGQLAKYRFDRVLNTLWTEFNKSFHLAFYKFALEKYWMISCHMHLPSYYRASEESKDLAKNFKQPTPQSITKEEVMNFKLRDEFQTLRSNCPLLYHVVCGALELGEDKLEVTPGKLQIISSLSQEPSYSLPGGTRSEVSLQEPIVQLMSQIHYLVHPRSRGLLAIVNGTFGVVNHLSQDTFKLENQLGRMVSRQSSLSVLDKLIGALNQV